MEPQMTVLDRSSATSYGPKSTTGVARTPEGYIHMRTRHDIEQSNNEASFATPEKQTSTGGLESLPPEVRRLVLSTLELPELKLLVRASPVFHQQYLHDRRHILCKSLQRTLGSVTVDAYAVHLFTLQRRNRSRNVAEFLRCYSESKARRWLELADKLTQDEAISMAAFYFHHVEPTRAGFVRWTLAKISDMGEHKIQGYPVETTTTNTEFMQFIQRHHAREIPTLTNTETMRFTRAAYRFQLLSQLADPNDRDIRLWREENGEAFFNILEPWERDELYSFYNFVEGIYEGVFIEVRHNLHPDHPRFDDQGRPPTPDGAFDLSDTSTSDTTTEYHRSFRWMPH